MNDISELIGIADADAWQHLLAAGTLVMVRLAGVMVFAPPFNSAAIPLRIKAAFVLALTLLLTPVAAALPQAHVVLSTSALLGEVGAGMLFGVSLMLLNEALLYAASILSISFSFSLANLLDPNSRVETPVLGTLMNWLGILVICGAGLDRVVLASVMRSLAVVPLGTAIMKMAAIKTVLAMVSGIFLAGLQLAAPLVAAAMAVEASTALVSRMAPTLPSQVIGIPIKTLVCYLVLMGAIGIWPRWVEGRFTLLLDAAQRMVSL